MATDPKSYPHAFLIPLELDHVGIDAKALAVTSNFAGSLVDFSLLPHSTKGEQCSPPRIRPNISEDLVSKPFEPTNDPLERGIHLRWTLPKEFRKARVTDLELEGSAREKPKPKFREVPNRWLIERRAYLKNESGRVPATYLGEAIVPQRWIIEADALSDQRIRGSRAFPYDPRPEGKAGYPGYKFVGKVYDYYDYLNPTENKPLASRFLPQLTAFGYGEPLYSAYYPESRNVFGFHDDLEFRLTEGQVPEDSEVATLYFPDGSTDYEFDYTVVGWYADPRKDPMTSADFKLWTPDAHEAEVETERPWGMEPYHTNRTSFPYGLLPEIDHGVTSGREEFNWLINISSPDNLTSLTNGTAARKEGWEQFLANEADLVVGDGGFEGPLTVDPRLSAKVRGRSIPLGRMEGVAWPPRIETTVEETRITNARVAIGNTPGQALAALLATGVSPAADGDEAAENAAKIAATERVLDALQLGLFGEEDKLDFPSRMEAGLHEAGFTSTVGEGYWVIREEEVTGNPALPQSNSPHPATAPPNDIWEEWVTELKAINVMQRELDKESYELDDQQRQYYADWYKYMLAEYDFALAEVTVEAHVNDIREYLARQVLSFSQTAKARVRKMDKLRLAAKNLAKDIRGWNDAATNEQKRYRLQPTPGPRYWEPREPVLLLEGERAVATKMYAPRTERLYVEMAPNLLSNTEESLPQKLLGLIKATEEELAKFDSIDKTYSSFLEQNGGETDWQPLYLDWEIELFPFTKTTDQDFNQKDWPTDAIVQKYELPDGEPDLRLQARGGDGGDLFKNWLDPELQFDGGKRIQTIQGRSILTAGAHRPLIEQMKKLLEQADAADGDQTGYAELIEKLEALPLLSQNLSGFNDALLMRKQVLQMKVTDPLAQTDILHQFTEELRTAIGGANDVAPLPSNLFIPLREGAFQIRELRLVDNWGRTRELQQATMNGQVVVAEALKPPPEAVDGQEIPPNLAYVAPRVVQPTRLNFRWISAVHPGSEAGAYAADSPICGYVVPNFLDQSLHAFDANGVGLGVIGRTNDELAWKPFPGRNITTVPNPHLERLVNSIIEHGVNYLADLLETARKSIVATQPENYAQFDGMPLLVGRPLALVRATMTLNLKGLPAIDNSWNSRQAEYRRTSRIASPTMGFDDIRFPVRISDAFKAGDGCLAWYLDKSEREDEAERNVEELYSYYVDKEGSRGEPFWAKLAVENKWLEIYQERLRARIEDIEELRTEIIGLTELKNYLSGLGSLTGRQRLELQGAERLLSEQIENRQRLEREQTELEGEVEERKTNIHNLNRSEFGVEGRGPGIYRPHGDLLTLSLAEDPIKVGLLMDPRAAVHLTTGILPVKRIDIPAEEFADALNNIQLAFLTTPVLSPRPQPAPVLVEGETATAEQLAGVQKFQLVSPSQEGFKWAWLQKDDRENWSEIPTEEIEAPPLGFLTDFAPQAIYEGWMKLLPEESD